MSVAGCPICGGPVEPRYRPFCSRRCADVDLQRWLVGRYVIAPREGDEEADSVSPGVVADDADG